MNRDHYTMDHFEVHLGSNNNAQMLGTHHPHFDHFGSWNFLHGKVHSLIDVVQPSTGMTANIDFRDEVIPCPNGRPPTHLDPIKIFRGENAEIVWKLRSDIPYLTKMEISDYRNAFYQNLCLCMLSLGYHRAFSEIFHLVERQELERQVAGPDSVLWSMSPISMQEDKLTLLKDCLCAAEDCYRKEDHRGRLESYNRLANFFKDYPEDKWLVDHFLQYCWEVSKKIIDDNNYKHAEANYYLGLAIEQNKTYEDAYGYFHALYELSKKQDWRVAGTRKTLHMESCEHLAAIRLKMADACNDKLPNLAVSQRISYFREAYDYAKESGNAKLEAQCSYKLGVSYHEADKPDVAIAYLNQFYSLSKSIEDIENLCLACESLANVYRSQRKFEDCIRFLEEFVSCAEAVPHMKATFCRACRALGDVYNELGDFGKASSYFSRSFGISRSIPPGQSGSNSGGTVDEARILFGVSQANNMNLTFNEHVHVESKIAVDRLIQWKRDCKPDNTGIAQPIPDKETDTIRNRQPTRNIFDHIGAYPKL